MGNKMECSISRRTPLRNLCVLKLNAPIRESWKFRRDTIGVSRPENFTGIEAGINPGICLGSKVKWVCLPVMCAWGAIFQDTENIPDQIIDAGIPIPS
jgi:hypothetical protein